MTEHLNTPSVPNAPSAFSTASSRDSTGEGQQAKASPPPVLAPVLPIVFTLDGRPLTTREMKQTAAAVLRLGGLDPAGYDLARVRPGHSDLERYTDDQQVDITPASLFVSIRQSAQVA